MWEKDNPGEGIKRKAAPARRNPEGLMGVKAVMPGGSDPAGTAAAAAGNGSPESYGTHTEKYGRPVAGMPAAKPGPASSGAVPPGMAPPAGYGPDANAEWARLIEFTGGAGSLLWLHFINLLLSIITLGIYSFWGKTKIRQYLWSQTRVLNEPLEYTGTGKELFISFLIVMPLLLVVMLCFSFLAQGSLALSLTLFYIGMLFLWQYASYRALRYRLTRTRWRGIRGNLSGSALTYAIKALGWLLIMVVTLGLATPWGMARLVRMQLNNVWFGDRPLVFNGPAKELAKSFFVFLASFAVIMAVGGYIIVDGIIAHEMMLSQGGSAADLEAMLSVQIFVAYFFILFGSIACAAYYQATLYRWLFEHMVFGKVRARSRVNTLQVLCLNITNTLLVLFTAGIGFAWAQVRSRRLYLHSVDYTGDPELNSLLQDDKAAPTHGEGLLDALDMDIGF